MNKRFSRADLLLLSGWLALLVLAMVWTTLALPYLSDDFEHVGLIAQIRAGLEPWRDLILLPFHSQTDVLIRLLFWFGTMAGGMSLTWVRLGICAAHVAGAVGCAILCARWTQSKLAGFLSGTLYAGALGFIGEQIWWPSSGIFCLGVTFFIFALVALDRDRIMLCLAMLAIAALGLNGILAAALGLPFCYWLLRGRRPPRGTAVTRCRSLLVAGLWRVGFSVRGLGLGAWLVFTAPFRFFSAWTTLGWPGFRTIWELAPLPWLALLVAAWFMNAPVPPRFWLAVWTPAILLALLVGMARADYPFRFGPGSLYTADRYYYVFLFPLVDALHFADQDREMAIRDASVRDSGQPRSSEAARITSLTFLAAISRRPATRSNRDVCWWRISGRLRRGLWSSPTRPFLSMAPTITQ